MTSIGLDVGAIRAVIVELRDAAGSYRAIAAFLTNGDLSGLSDNALKLIENATGLPSLIADCASTF